MDLVERFLALNNTVTILDFSLIDEGIQCNGAAAIARALTHNNSTLKTLRLNGNSIGDAGAAAISTALSTNNTLTVLDLSRNSIGAAMKAELQAAKSASLASLNL